MKVAAPKKEVKAKAAPAAVKGDAKPSAGSAQPKPVKRPTTGVKKAGAAKKPPARAQPSPPREQELSQEEVDARAERLFTADILSGRDDLRLSDTSKIAA